MRRYLLEKWYVFLSRIQMRTMLTCLTGILFSFLILALFEKSKYYLIVGAIVAGGVFLFFRRTRIIVRYFLIPVLIGAIYFILFSHFIYMPSASLRGKDIFVTGYTKDIVKNSVNSRYIILDAEKATVDGKTRNLSGDVLVYFAEDRRIDAGAKIVCRGHAFEDETADDDVRYDIRVTKGQYLTMYASEIAVKSLPGKWNVYRILSFMRRQIRQRYDSIYGSDVSAFLNGLTLGDREGIDDEIYYAFKNSGVSHVLAVSGMHLSFLCALVWFLLSLLHIPLKPRAVLQILLIWGFTAVSGFSPSCCRAAVMLTLFHVGILFNKESDPLTGLALAVFLCCVVNPFAVVNPSLCLSASATLGILLLLPRIKRLVAIPKTKKRIFSYFLNFLWNAFAMSVAATVGCMPVLMLMFQTVSLLSPVTNVLIALPIEAMFILAFLSLPLAAAAVMRSFCAVPMEWMYRYCVFVTRQIAKLPISTVYTGNIRFWVFSLAVVLLLLILYLNRRRIGKAVAFAALICLCAVIGGTNYLMDLSSVDVVKAYFVNVGQGNTTIIANRHGAVMIDCGGTGTGYRAIDHTMLKAGLQTVDTVYLTHLDLDHISFLEYMISKYGVQKIAVPKRAEYSARAGEIIESAKRKGIGIAYLVKDDTIRLWDKADLEVITSHIDLSAKTENQNSVVYRFVYGETEILFPGDLEGKGESAFLDLSADLSCDILEIPHHGSDGSSSARFLKRVGARVAVISVGKDNEYGLPGKGALFRIGKFIPEAFRTDLNGTICIYCKKDHYSITEKY